MRSTSILLLLLLCACGGGIAPGSDQQSSGGASRPFSPDDPSGGSSSNGSAGSPGSTGSGGSDSTSSSSASARCTPGSYVFCRCGDGSEGTKLCSQDGASFGPCACGAKPPPDCHYPPTSNPPGCPATYSYTYGGKPCPTANLECHYPGAGDGQSDGCFATALLACEAQPDGAQVWTAAQ